MVPLVISDGAFSLVIFSYSENHGARATCKGTFVV